MHSDIKPKQGDTHLLNQINNVALKGAKESYLKRRKLKDLKYYSSPRQSKVNKEIRVNVPSKMKENEIRLNVSPDKVHNDNTSHTFNLR